MLKRILQDAVSMIDTKSLKWDFRSLVSFHFPQVFILFRVTGRCWSLAQLHMGHGSKVPQHCSEVILDLPPTARTTSMFYLRRVLNHKPSTSHPSLQQAECLGVN